jgi:hypothetical protein
MLLKSLLHGIVFQWISHEILGQISNGFAFSDSFISLSKMRIVHGWEAHMTWGLKHNLENYHVLMGVMFWILKLIKLWWVFCFESWNLSCFDDGCYLLNFETYHVLMGIMFWILKLIAFWWVLCFESWNLSCFDNCYVSSLICSHIELPWTSLPKSPDSDNLQNL